MTATVVSTEVDRSAEEVFAYVTDPARFAEWQDGVVEGHLDPPRTWGVRGVDGPIRADVDVTVEPLGEDRSRVTIAVGFRGHGIGKVLVPLVVERQARKEMPTNLTRLKQRVEST